jgi:hypothetical protein
MRFLRGQSAIEYMMTYGWAILVVLVAGIVLWQMGYLELGRNITPDKRGFSQLTPLDWSLIINANGLGNLTLIIQNNAGTVVEIQADGTAASMTSGGTGSCTLSTALPITDVRPGTTKKIEFVNCPLQVAKTGEYYRVNVTIAYQAKSGLPHRSNGVVWGPIG